MSPRAACRLEALGYPPYAYVDGIADWKAAGFPTEGTAEPGQTVADATRADVPTCRPDETVGRIVLGWSTRAGMSVWWSAVTAWPLAAFATTFFDSDPNRTTVQVMEPGPSTVRPDGQLQPLVQRMEERNART